MFQTVHRSALTQQSSLNLTFKSAATEAPFPPLTQNCLLISVRTALGTSTDRNIHFCHGATSGEQSASDVGNSLVPFAFRQPPTSNWHKISWISCSFFCSYVEKQDVLENLDVLSRFVQIKRVLLCVLNQAGNRSCTYAPDKWGQFVLCPLTPWNGRIKDLQDQKACTNMAIYRRGSLQGSSLWSSTLSASQFCNIGMQTELWFENCHTFSLPPSLPPSFFFSCLWLVIMRDVSPTPTEGRSA